MSRPSRFLSLFLATSVLLGATACDDDDDEGVGPTTQGRVRAIHAIGNGPAVDIVADNAVVREDLTFGQKTNYLSVAAGTRALAVRAANQTANLLTASQAVTAGADYTVIAAGRLGATTGPTPRLIAIADAAAPAAGQASIRVVHASPAAGNVDVYATAPGADIATATPVLSNVAFGAVATPLVVPAGTYRFRITPAGSRTVAIDVNNVAVAAGKFIAVAVGDNAPGTGNASALSILLFPENAN
jgi:hypothetical protein